MIGDWLKLDFDIGDRNIDKFIGSVRPFLLKAVTVQYVADRFVSFGTAKAFEFAIGFEGVDDELSVNATGKYKVVGVSDGVFRVTCDGV